MKIPNWKIKREARRILAQIQQIPWILFASRIRRRFDENAANLISYHAGEQPLQNNIAILLLFQPTGVSESTYITLKHLISEGFTPVVVSNAGLMADDYLAIKRLSHMVIERPNFGYDFGGYRDGIRYILQNETHPDNLLVINDSIWFPIYPDCTFLSELKCSETDLYGLVINDQYKTEDRHHIQSYMFNFKKNVVSSAAFKEYWNNLFLSNNKNAVIRQCEIKMTHYFRARGFSAGAKFSLRDIYAAFDKLSPQEFELIVDYQMKIDPKRIGFLKRYRQGSDIVNRMYLIKNQLIGKYLLIAHPVLLIKYLKFPALKRDRQYIYQLQRDELSKHSLDSRLISIVRSEVRDRSSTEKNSVDGAAKIHAS
ncbi:rhamnan synthesis F family protein [Agrobacterium cavarae]|uniref:rhamnan synthesis F family protein n=1 Tax=Agrobacterium cavarae TaxID=2528239 RepID=UPI003FD61CBF